MRKIPTLFLRDPDDMSRLLRDVHPDCHWVVDGEGVATRKVDGTCVMFDDADWWARREVKPGKPEPDGFVPVEHDDETGKTVGWEPLAQSAFAKLADEAIRASAPSVRGWIPGTYELVGPKVNGNPEDWSEHALLSHADAETWVVDPPRDFDDLAGWLVGRNVEGIVWHHADGRMAKIKGRDFGFKRGGEQ